MKINIDVNGGSSTDLWVEIIKHSDALGAKRPVTFVLPGGPGADHTAYLGYACLQEVTDLVFHDPRGCGRSDKSNLQHCTMNNYIDDVERIRQELSINKIILVGKSYGSMCALGYALRYPAAVEKLVLAAGAPSYRFLESAKKNLKQRGTPEQIKITEKLWSGDFKSRDEILNFFKLTNTLYSVKARTKPERFDLMKKSSQFSYKVLNEGFKHAFWHFDFEKELPQILCPTLVLAGREDWINDITHAEFMSERIPHSRLHIFDHASHAMEADVTDEYFQTIADFIRY